MAAFAAVSVVSSFENYRHFSGRGHAATLHGSPGMSGASCKPAAGLQQRSHTVDWACCSTETGNDDQPAGSRQVAASASAVVVVSAAAAAAAAVTAVTGHGRA